MVHELTHDVPINTVEAFSKSMKFMYNGVCHLLDCSISILRVAVWSVKDLSFLNPA